MMVKQSGVTAFYHICVSTHFWFACWYDWYYVQVPFEKNYGNFGRKANKLKYLTYWNAVLQGIFFTLCAISDFKKKKDNDLIRVRSLVFSSLAFPLSMFVGLTFWGIYIVDRELIFPITLEKYFPAWLNHALHSNILVFTLIELLMSSQRYPTRKTGISILISFMALYLIWIHLLYLDSGFWVYPILNVLSLPLRIFFFLTLLIFSVSLYIIGDVLNNVICKLKSIDKKK